MYNGQYTHLLHADTDNHAHTYIYQKSVSK